MVLPSERDGSSVVGHDQQYCYHHAPTVKPEAATAVVEREDARNMLRCI